MLKAMMSLIFYRALTEKNLLAERVLRGHKKDADFELCCDE